MSIERTNRLRRGARSVRSGVHDLYGDTLAIGAVAGPYVVDALAYEGGFATIYRAYHPRTREHVALKVLRRELAESVRITLRFQQEAETLRLLSHPHIVRVLDVGELYDGRPYIAMEWIPGRNLAQELAARGAFSTEEALGIMAELGAAVSAAHALGIVHRDIKAENIVAVPCGDWFATKLVDFGIAKLTDPEHIPAFITQKSIVGTPLTMAPEQILGEPVDVRTDIYALGVLLYRLVTGRPPFAGTAAEVEDMHLHTAPPAASELAPVSPAFDAVVARALAKAKADRYATVHELLTALRATVHGAVRPAASASPALGAAAAPAVAVAVRVEARALTGASGDALDLILDHALEGTQRAGLTLVIETSSQVLAAAILPTDSRSADTARLQVVTGALCLASELAALAAPAGVAVSVAVHVAGVHTASDPATGGRAITGGELVQLGQWPAPLVDPLAAPSILASAAAVAGLGAALELIPVPGAPTCYRVERVRADGADTQPATGDDLWMSCTRISRW